MLALQTAAAPAEKPAGQLLQWQELRSSGGLLSAYRTAVPGGWLVYVSNGYLHHGGVTFYPDPEHRWSGESVG